MLRKRYLPIAALTAMLLALGVIGYLMPAETPEPPVRILMPNAGGNVIFNHQAHAEQYGVACESCHHETAGETAMMPSHDGSEVRPLACDACHAKELNAAYVAEHKNFFDSRGQCFTCHHIEYRELLFQHDAHLEYTGEDCQLCHHSEDIEPEPQACANCHGEQAQDAMPRLADAAHTRCQQCHEDQFSPEMTGCATCHAAADLSTYKGKFSACSDCHETPPGKLILNRMGAYHNQCMGCHRELGQGPYKDDECSRCHRM